MLTNLTLQLDDLSLATRTEETFDDLIDRKQYSTGPLVELNKLRLSLVDNQPFAVSITGKSKGTEVLFDNVAITANEK